jgi:hypothetical protein
MGSGWASSPAETVNGAGISWVRLERTPAAFNPNGFFLGTTYVAEVSMPMNNLKAMISSSNQGSGADRTLIPGTDDIAWGTEKYVVLALLRLYQGRYLRVPRLGAGNLANFIGGRFRDLLRVPYTPGNPTYPVISLESGTISYGHSAHTWRFVRPSN